MPSVWVAIILIVGQGVIAGTVLYVMDRFTKRLEGFTQALLETQASNQAMRDHALALMDELRGLRARNAAGEVA